MNFNYQPFKDIENRDEKIRLAEAAAAIAKSGDLIGAGSGSTSYLTLIALSERVRAGEISDLFFIPTSLEIEWVIKSLNLQLLPFQEKKIDWLFDGADSVAPGGNLIKGRGGALVREKEMFHLTDRRIIVADKTKIVPSLDNIPIPVEVERGSYPEILKRLESAGAKSATLRTGTGKDGPTITERGNLIIDTVFPKVYPELEQEIAKILGVFESGLFQQFEVEVIC